MALRLARSRLAWTPPVKAAACTKVVALLTVRLECRRRVTCGMARKITGQLHPGDNSHYCSSAITMCISIDGLGLLLESSLPAYRQVA
jgi:hypothetical protein